MSGSPPIERVMVTGATGLVGRCVVRKLLARGVKPICVVRSPQKLFSQHDEVESDRLTAIAGSLGHCDALQEAAGLSQAAIHLVGIIIERRLKGQTFRGVHIRGTKAVVDAVVRAKMSRFVHISALGTRENAASAYHRSKWEAEEYVRKSGLDWTILRPSLIHGAHGDFMRLMRRFMCGLVPPMIPFFGSGEAKVQPVSVKDVAYCAVESLFCDEAIGKTIPLGGPDVFSWTGFYNACRALMPEAKHWKPMVSQPVSIAKLVATLSAPPLALAEMILPPIGMFRFDRGQVQMSQEDNVCDHTVAEKMFNIRMRSFEAELATYAGLIE